MPSTDEHHHHHHGNSSPGAYVTRTIATSLPTASVPRSFHQLQYQPRYTNAIFPREPERLGPSSYHVSSSPPEELSSIGVRFIDEVSYEDMYGVVSFIRENKNVLAELNVQKVYSEAAFSCLSKRQFTRAQCCIERMLIVYKCQELRAAQKITTWLGELVDKDGSARNQFRDEFALVWKRCLEKHGASLREDTAQVRRESNASGVAYELRRLNDLSIREDHDIGNLTEGRHEDVSHHHPRDQLAQPTEDLPFATAGQLVRTNTRRSKTQDSNSLYERQLNGQSAFDLRSNVDKISFRGPSGQSDTYVEVDRRFYQREAKNASKFFSFGRVFAMMHYAQDTAKFRVVNGQLSPFQHETRDGDIVRGHMSRMVVVKEGRGFCWAISISTYGNQGLKKKGLKGESIHEHAVVHIDGKPAINLSNEPISNKHPIAVIPIDNKETLHEASRINFAQPTTVQHNVRARNIGTIAEASMVYFQRYCKLHLNVEPKEAEPTSQNVDAIDTRAQKSQHHSRKERRRESRPEERQGPRPESREDDRHENRHDNRPDGRPGGRYRKKGH